MGRGARERPGWHALIIATSQYEDGGLRRLRAPSRDAEELARVLTDPDIGGYRVRSLLNKPDHVARVEIDGFFADAHVDDLLLLYISGHGVRDQAGHLHFAAVNTKLNRLASTAISAEFVYQQVEHCRSRKIVLLLDCCYSGAYGLGRRPRTMDDASLGSLGGGGWTVITSSTALEYAFEMDVGQVAGVKMTRKAEPSVFTAAVVEGLRTGDADRDRDGLISVDELYEYVWSSVRKRTPPQTPEKKWGDIRGDIIIARNPHLKTPGDREKSGKDEGDGALVRISRRQAVQGLVGTAVVAALLFTGWELTRGGRGTMVWKVTTTNGVTASPVVADGVVFASNQDGKVYALRASDGVVLWRQQTQGNGVIDGLVVQDHIVYGRSGDGAVFALLASDGTPLWQSPFGQTLTPPAVAAGVAYVGGQPRGVYALRATDGDQIWHSRTDSSIYLRPAAVGDTVYATDGRKVYALRAQDGREIWSSAPGAESAQYLAVAANSVLWGGEGAIYALHAGNGKPRWKTLTLATSPLVVAGNVVCASGNGYVYALRMSDGKQLWRHGDGDGTWFPPKITRGTVYVSRSGGTLYALRASNGARMWHFAAGGDITSACAFAQRTLYLGSNDHNIYALRADNGQKIWSFATGAEVSASPTLADGIAYVGGTDGNIYALRA